MRQGQSELSEMINNKAYKEKYMYGICYLKNIIEVYGRECVQAQGYCPLERIDFRIKTAGSIADKLGKKGYGISCENAIHCLSDLAGVRVVCFSEKDVYLLADYLCGRKDIVIVRRKDYIRTPKENGYRSLHLITEMEYPAKKQDRPMVSEDRGEEEKVRVELQLRTGAMHRWAENDHRKFYKKLTQ